MSEFKAAEIPMDAVSVGGKPAHVPASAPKEEPAKVVTDAPAESAIDDEEVESDAVRSEDESEDEVSSEDDEGGADGEGDDEEGEETEEDEVEFNFGGTKQRFKKSDTVEVVAERMQQFANDLYSGVNKKFQEVANIRKEVERRDEAVQAMASLAHDYYAEYGRAQLIKADLEKLQNVDWQQLWSTDHDKARQLSDLTRQREQELIKIANSLEAKENAANAKRQEFVAKTIELGKAKVEKAIPGFTEKHAKEVIDYALSVGVSKEDAENWAVSPEVAIMAYKAMKYDNSLKAVKKPTTPKQIADKPVKQAQARSGRTPRDIGTVAAFKQMPSDQWIRARIEAERKGTRR